MRVPIPTWALATIVSVVGTCAAAGEPSADLTIAASVAAAEYQGSAASPELTPLPEAGGAGISDPRIDALEGRIGELEEALALSQSVWEEAKTQAWSAPLPDVPDAPAPKPKEDPSKMSAGWGENGFTATSADKNFKIHIGGRVQVDAVALNTNDLVLGGVGDADAVDFRRARFRIDGTMYRTIDWAAEFDFVNGQNFDPTTPAAATTEFGGNVGNVVTPTDLYCTFRELPLLGNARIGNQKEPIGLEHMNSSRFLDFMERSYLQDAFYGPFNNGFCPGVTVFDWNENETATWWLGGFKNTHNGFAYDTGDNEYALDGRLTCVPWAADEDSELVHMGIGACYRGMDPDANPADGNIRVRSRASLRNGPGPLNPNLADTNFAGRLFVESEMLLAPELAVVLGPWLFQTEYVAGFLNSTTFTPIAGAPVNLGQVYFQGSYVEALYFLTGEHRAYDRHEARFGRVKPNQNASVAPGGCGFCGWGAWQVGARYGFLDLTDAGIDGDYIQDMTLGLNWFLNPFSKFQFNYILQHVDNTQRNGAGAITAENDGNLYGFGVRFAWDF